SGEKADLVFGDLECFGDPRNRYSRVDFHPIWRKRGKKHGGRKIDRGALAHWIWRRFVRVLARRPFVRKKFRNAWLLMDRDTDADDSAEALYRWLRDNRPEINAYF